jgi:ADP-ribosylglycohydrolase
MDSLHDKMKGCIAGSWIGSAMGAVVEGWPVEKVKSTYGVLDRLLPYSHYIEFTDWKRPAGTTEDGIERQKLIATAIIEKKDRITSQDLAATWIRDLDPDKMVYKQEPYDRALALLLKSGLPGNEGGRLSMFQNVVTMSRSSHPIGLINAGDPGSAADDTYEAGKLYLPETAFGLRWAALYNAAIAESLRPGASVSSVLDTAVRFADYRAEPGPLYKGAVDKFAYDRIRWEVDRALEIAEKSADPEDLKRRFNEIFSGGYYVTYGLATASEIVAKGLAVFSHHKGRTRDAIVTAVNFGRDTDCLAATAAGLCGSLTGTAHIPQDWIDQVDAATREDPYTNNRRTIGETADGLYEAFRTRHKKLAEYVRMMAQ